MSEDWSVSEEDYEDAGPSKSEPPPVGKYTFKIEEPKLGKDKNGNPFYGLRLRVENGPQANRVVFENYLPFVPADKRKRTSAATGKEYTDSNWRRFLSFLASIGHSGGTPPGFPGSDIKIEDRIVVEEVQGTQGFGRARWHRSDRARQRLRTLG